MADLLIKNANAVLTDKVMKADILIENGKFSEILPAGTKAPEAKEIIDAGGLFVFPGAIDTHAHLNDPGYTWREDFAHGTAAAAVGGYTTIIDMPLQNEPATTTAKLAERKISIVEPNAYTDFCLWGGLVPDNFGELKDMWDMGVVIFKSFIGPVSPDYAPLNYGQAIEAMRIIASFGGKAGFHCEDFSAIKHLEKVVQAEGRNDWRAFLDSRPVIAEMIATDAIIEISRATGCKAHICHVSHPDVAAKIKAAQQEGVPVTAETCGHYLSFTEDDVIEHGALFKCAPPLRTKADQDRLWEYVLDGTFSGVASDHSPCTYEEKFTEILGQKIETVFDVWGGISGIQSCVQAAFSEGCVKRGADPVKLARAMSENAAKAFGIWGKKGAIKEGFDADMVFIDPEKDWEITADELLYINKISAFVGMKGKGLPVRTILKGKTVALNGKPVGDPTGKFVRRV